MVKTLTGVPENGTYMWRKAFEVAMAGQPGEPTLCVKKRAKQEDRRPKRKQPRPARTTELVVRQEGETFASIVGRLKEAASKRCSPEGDSVSKEPWRVTTQKIESHPSR